MRAGNGLLRQSNWTPRRAALCSGNVKASLPVGRVIAVSLALSVVGVGVTAGLAGVLTGLLLQAVQRLAYGSASGDVFAHLLPAHPWMRVALLGGAGLVVGLAWWGLHRSGRSPVSVSEAVNGERMRTLPMVSHVVLQLFSVGMGASIGREVAPRELGAVAATWTEKLAPALTPRQRRLLIGAGAGAGLAAAYHVPIAGALYAVEILLADFSVAALGVAAATSAVAALVSSVLLPGGPLYRIPPVSFSPSLLMWALLAGPMIGILATGFSRVAHFAAEHRPKGWRLLVMLPITYTGLGAVSLVLPQVLGNGQSLATSALVAQLPLALAGVLFVAKAATTTATIGAGAYGGTLTPSLSLGAVFGLGTGILWCSFWHGSDLTAFALCGAGAFLSGSMAAPLTALALTIELTGEGLGIAVPLVIAVGLSTLVRWLLDNRGRRGQVGLRHLEETEPAAEERVST